jgi:serine/threonine-protein kinase
MQRTGQDKPLLGGRYRVLRQLGQGGFGNTYLVEDVNRFQELCVVKEFNPQVRDKIALDKAQKLFEREANILYQLNHPQIPKFRELLRQGDRLFLVQDYTEGPSYHELLNRRKQYAGHFSESEVTQLLTQLLPVLQYLHSVGIVHRDISPDNLIQRNADSRPVLIDFGGVKQLVVNVRYQLGVPEPYHSDSGQVTLLGKEGYAPTEQMESGQVSPSTDLYALGITALVLLTGKEPGELYDDRKDRWVWQDDIQISDQLSHVLNRLVAKDPGQRFQSASQVMAALNLDRPYSNDVAWNQNMPVRMQPVVPPPPRTVAVAPAAPPPTRTYRPSTAMPSGQPSPVPVNPPTQVHPRRSGGGGWLAALAGLMVIGGVAAALWWWLDPLDWRMASDSEVVSPEGSDSENPAFDEAEQARKQALSDRTLELNVDRGYLTRLTDQLFFEQNPELKGAQLTDQPQDAALRAEWDAIATANLDLIEANLSAEARERLGRFNPADTDRWRRQANELNVSENALFDLADARFWQLFPDQRQGGFVETPVDQIWFGLAQDSLSALQSGASLEEVQFPSGTYSEQLEATLEPGAGQVYILNLSQDQLMRVNLQAPSNSTRLSIYVPVPSAEDPYLLADSEDTTWAGELPQSGYYEIVVVNWSDQPITYTLNVAVDNVENEVVRPVPPESE